MRKEWSQGQELNPRPTGAMMLDFLGEPAAGAAIVRAIESALEPGSDAPRTPDIGGKAKTSDLGKAIAEAV